MEIDDNIIFDINELVSRLIFISFGTVPTDVDITYTIIDEFGKAVHSEKVAIVVETEKILTKNFKDIDLPLSKYTLIAKTVYNTDVVDEFTQEFEITISKWQTTGYASVILAITALMIFIPKRRK